MTLNAEIERTQAYIPDMTIDQSNLPPVASLTASTLKSHVGESTPPTLPTVIEVQDADIPQTEEEMLARAAVLMGDLEGQTGLLVDLPWNEILQREEQLVEELQEAKQEVEKVRAKYQLELKRMEAEIQAATEKLDTANLRIVDQDKNIQDLSMKVKELSDAHTELLHQKVEWEEQAEKQRVQIVLLTEQMDSLQESLSTAEEKNGELEAKINILEEEKAQWEHQKESLATTQVSGSETAHDLELQIQELSARILVKESDCSDLESKLESLQDLHSEQLARVQALLDIETQNRLALEQEKTVLKQKQADLAARCYQLEQDLESEKSKKKAEPVVPPHIKKHYEDMEKKYIQAKKYAIG